MRTLRTKYPGLLSNREVFVSCKHLHWEAVRRWVLFVRCPDQVMSSDEQKDKQRPEWLRGMFLELQGFEKDLLSSHVWVRHFMVFERGF